MHNHDLEASGLTILQQADRHADHPLDGHQRIVMVT